MNIPRLLAVSTLAALSGCSGSITPARPDTFDAAEIRAAERGVIAALESSDPTAWVYFYTEDAVLLEPGAAPVEGRQALLDMARAMTPLSSVTIAPIRTEGQATVAYTFGSASWVNGRPPNAGSTTHVRVVMIWRREADGPWRIALESFSPEAPNQQAERPAS